MDKIEKALKKFDEKEKAWIKDILLELKSYSLKGLNIKKLKGHNNIFRVRRGDIRIIYRLDENQEIYILTIDRRNEDTYKF